MRKFIKPAAPGLLVRDHNANQRPLPEKGKWVAWDTTWSRRLSSGDIVEVAPPKDVKESAKSTGRKPEGKAVSNPKSED